MNPRSSGALDIRMVIPGLPIMAPDPLAVSLGGSETAGLQLAAELVRQGHRVAVACNTPEPFEWQGVRLQSGFCDAEVAEPCDLFLVQRQSNYLRFGGRARARFLWLHDQAGSLGSGEADRYLFVSQWQAERFRAQAPDLAARFAVIRNGIDLEVIAEATAGVERDPFRIVYTSRPERGLEVLIRGVLPMILGQEPRASLHIAGYAFPGSGLDDYYRTLRELAEPFGDRIVWHEPLAKRELYRLMASGGCFLYPTPAPFDPEFAETSCITAMEAMACGLPWISTDCGALPETVGDAGVLMSLGDAPHAAEPAVMDRLVGAAMWIMHEPRHAARLRKAGLTRVQELGWRPVAEQIVNHASQVAREGTASQPRRTVVASKSSSPTIQISTPAYDRRVDVGFVGALIGTLQLLERAGYRAKWGIDSECALVHLARNAAAARFLGDSDVSHLLMVDSDIIWPPEAVLRLLRHGHDVVVGVYAPRTEGKDGFPVGPLFDGQGQPVRDEATGCYEIEWCGAGFMLIAREVFLRVIEMFPANRITTARYGWEQRLVAAGCAYDFFPTRLHDGFVDSEDIGFCRLVRAAGHRIWLDPAVQLGHVGNKIYRGDPMSMFAPAELPGAAA